jgi:hypothetical protein
MNEKPGKTGKPSLLAIAWKKLQPEALAAVIDFGRYLLLWLQVAAAHLVRVMFALMGVDPEVVRIVAFIEKWFWIASFSVFFARAVIRLYRMK